MFERLDDGQSNQWSNGNQPGLSVSDGDSDSQEKSELKWTGLTCEHTTPRGGLFRPKADDVGKLDLSMLSDF